MTDTVDRFETNSEGEGSAHLTLDQLNAYLDDDLNAVDRRQADNHLATCEVCQPELALLRAMVSLLATMPEHRPRRSFQLDQRYARRTPPWWRGIGLRLLPSMPAIRAATVAAAVLLVAVTAGDLLQQESHSNLESMQVVPESTAALVIQPTSEATETPAPLGESARPASEPTWTGEPVGQAEPAEPTVESVARVVQATMTPAQTAATEEMAGEDALAQPSEAQPYEESDQTTDSVAIADEDQPDDQEAGSIGGDGESDAFAANAAPESTTGNGTGSGDAAGSGGAGAGSDATGAPQTEETAEEPGDAGVLAAAEEAESSDTAASGGEATGDESPADDSSMAMSAPSAAEETTAESGETVSAEDREGAEAITSKASPAAPTGDGRGDEAATPAAAPIASPVASPAPMATPHPAPTPAAVQTDAAAGDDGVSGWRIAQIALAIALAWLAVTVIGLQRLRRGGATRA